MKTILKITSIPLILTILVVLLAINSCSSVFEGGASGKVVDAESTSEPKAGIQDVEVFVYTSEYQRNEDYRTYSGTGRFNPSGSEYIGHTTTGSDGSFSLGKIMWESDKPIFGKTGDYIQVYLLFYHDSYGLVKNSSKTIILSDSVSNIIYQEMTAIRQTTALNISILDISQDPDSNTKLPPLLSDSVNITVSAPQAVAPNIKPDPTVKTATISGTGQITVSYPREMNETVTIAYGQAGSYISYRPCKYITTEGSEDYSFLVPPARQTPVQTSISSNADDCQVTVNVKGTSTPVLLYMKPVKHSMPSISGQLCLGTPASPNDEGDASDDNIPVFLAKVDASNNITGLYDYTSAVVMTSSEGNGANGSRIRHGFFSGLGQGIVWDDDTYAGKYSTTKAAVIFDMDKSHSLTSGDRYIILNDIRSNMSSYSLGKLESTDPNLITLP